MSQLFSNALSRISQHPFGTLADGTSATLYTLTNKQGMQVKITDFGAIIVSIFTPDKTNRMADIVLGYDNVADYQDDTYYLGAVIGRYAGRIEQGKITIDGQDYRLTLNAADSQLHGGSNGFNKQLWQATTAENSASASLTLALTSPDGDNGFPGNLNVKVSYCLDDENQLTVEYSAQTDKPTLLNLTQHSYFNLAGHNAGSIAHHQVQINADTFLPMTEKAYPTGELQKVSGTPHDFQSLTPLSSGLHSTDEQIRIGKGFDNYWLVNEDVVEGKHFAAKVFEPMSGREMTLYTDQPSMILYTANYIDGTHVGKQRFTYQQRGGLCLEPQRANNRKHGANISNTILRPDAPFLSRSVYCFSVKSEE